MLTSFSNFILLIFYIACMYCNSSLRHKVLILHMEIEFQVPTGCSTLAPTGSCLVWICLPLLHHGCQGLPFGHYGLSFGRQVFALVIRVFPLVNKVFPSVIKVFPSVTKVFPSITKVFPLVCKVFPSVTKVFPCVTKGFYYLFKLLKCDLHFF